MGTPHLTRWSEVDAWLAQLRQTPLPDVGLSPQGANAALTTALDALHPSALNAVAAMPGVPFESARFIAAGTVFTAPLEWCAVLLGRGTEVTLKVPAAGGLTSVAAQWVQAARLVELPLRITTEAGLGDEDLVVAMGSDQTVARLRDIATERPHGPPKLLAFGHRFSCAVIQKSDPFDGLARDVTLHDTRGCMSPVWVLTVGAPEAPERLAEAMSHAQTRWPRGDVSPAEHASIRARRALATVVGQVHRGDGWEVHVLPPEHAPPVALPRCVAVVPLPSHEQVHALLLQHKNQLSTVGSSSTFELPPSVRQCPNGQMQAPPVRRLHDGVDWLHATLLSVE